MARNRKQESSPLSVTMPIEVDPGFRRVCADRALVMYLGHDVDIAFLAIGPRLERITSGRGESESDRMHTRPQLNEVARIRIHPSGGATLAVEILQALIKVGVANKEAVITALQTIEEPNRGSNEKDEEAVLEADAFGVLEDRDA